ncbi:glycosyltransferase [Roseomonas sp. CCTCC AB2023176]|uniref:glycosyltransferase n=1 Tax=Roseomonas sp. CCTCC AB2023176 TaxID=3342640 RepID=UPI0035E156C1
MDGSLLQGGTDVAVGEPSRPRRVLHVLKYYRPAFSGEGVFLERSSAVMQELAPTVTHELLVTHTPRPADLAEGAACSSLVRVSYLAPDDPGTLIRHVRLVAWFVRNLWRFDTIHVRTHADWYFLTYLLSHFARRRLVLSATLDDSLQVLTQRYRPALRRIAARGFALFDAFVSISPKLDAETREAGADPARCHLIPCGVTVPPTPPGQREEVRARLGIGTDDPVLLFVGGLCERKDPLFLVRALPRLRRRHPAMRLILVGPPLEEDHVAAIRRTIAEERLETAVLMVGEQRDPHPFFAAADILVFASKLEGFGTVVPEGMAHGRPVVVRRLRGVNDSFVLQGETGFLFDDEDGLVDGVDRLAADPALHARMGAAGRALADREFAMRRIAARYLRVYGADVPAPEPGPGRETRLGCDASVHDGRFHAPVAPPDGPPLLITMVDAEEAFDWSQPFSRQTTDVSSMRSQHLAHRIYERYGAVPVYLTDYPVATQDAGRAPLRELVAGGHAEIGAQMHPWVTPPYLETVNDHNSYAGNLPTTLELEKARRLTDALEEAFGERPRIYRSGRFGAGLRTADILKHLGYEADSSVVPYWPPEGSEALRHNVARCARPHWIDRERTLLEIPVSAGLVGALAGTRVAAVAPRLFGRPASGIGLPAIAARLALLERIRLSPEGMTLDEAKRLTRQLLREGQRVFVLTYHSPSLEPGNTPYVRTVAERDALLRWLDAYFAFFHEEVGGRCASWREVRRAARGAAAA